jgi:hypothetical protein
MKNRSGNNLVNLFLSSCLIFCVFGCSDSDTETSPQSRPAEAATYSIEHWQLLSEFAENEVAADGRYTGKRLRVTGPIDFVSVESGHILARFSVPATSYTQLFAEFSQSQKAAASTIKRGQQVALECTCRGLTGYGRLEMNDCVLD